MSGQQKARDRSLHKWEDGRPASDQFEPSKKFVLETGSGQKLELPADTRIEKIDHLLGALKQMDDVKKISVE